MSKRLSRLRPRSLSLRTKLLLASLVVLAIPGVGYQYVREMEIFLRQGQEAALLSTARAVATVLHEQPELFQSQGDLLHSVPDEGQLYVRPLEHPIKLDGKTDDWQAILGKARHYGAEHVLASEGPYRPESISFRHLMGTYGRYLYILFQVKDDNIVYRTPNTIHLDQSDHLQIAMQDPEGAFHRYLLTTQAPGWVNAHLMSEGDKPIPIKPEVSIEGEWQETEQGYTLELRIPVSMIGDKLAFAIGDVDDPKTRKIDTVIGTSGTRVDEELGAVLVVSPEIEKLLKGLQHSASRLWVVDRNRRVLALAGSLQTEPEDVLPQEPRSILSSLLHTVYRVILPQPSYDFEDDVSGITRLEGQELDSALNGEAAIHWRSAAHGMAILAAAQPVFSAGKVIGAVVVEQTSIPILTLQNRAMEKLFNVTLVVFLVATFTMLIFASRVSLRIRRLRDEAERAIGADGRVQGTITHPKAHDELGDLARSFSDLLERIGQYTRYLENMAGKLSHELRTPLAVVRSSLENLEMQSLPDEAATYTKRAKQGIDRLASILSSMSEATRLEQMLSRSETEDFDLGEVVSSCVEAYRSIYPHKRFVLEQDKGAILLHGVPDLIVQMLDKLISNAVDFSEGKAPIIVRLTKTRHEALLSVVDAGTPLPAQMSGRLFESMVSIRPQRNDEAPHLGMGLYIVRLIAAFHGGSVQTEDRKDVPGAIFRILLPYKGEAPEGSKQ